MTKTRYEILTVGSMAFDSIRSPAGEAEQILGGSGNYFSLAASFFAPIHIVAVVGADFPKAHLEFLQARGVNVDGVEIIAGGKTFHWVGEYNENLNEAKTVSTQLNVFEKFAPKLTQDQKSSPYLFLANIDPVLQVGILDQCNGHRFVACDTMNFWITGKLNELKQVLKRVDLLSINEGEAYLLSKKRGLMEAARAIMALGPSAVVIKRGEYGATLFFGDDVFLAPAYPTTEVKDPTGAGDSFAGAMIGFLAENQVHRDWIKKDPAKLLNILKRGVLSGCTMASFTVEDFGIQRLMRLNKDELVGRQRELMNMISL